MSQQIHEPKATGLLLSIVLQGDFKRLTPADYESLLALRDHWGWRLEMVQAAIARCPTSNQPAANA